MYRAIKRSNKKAIRNSGIPRVCIPIRSFVERHKPDRGKVVYEVKGNYGMDVDWMRFFISSASSWLMFSGLEFCSQISHYPKGIREEMALMSLESMEKFARNKAFPSIWLVSEEDLIIGPLLERKFEINVRKSGKIAGRKLILQTPTI